MKTDRRTRPPKTNAELADLLTRLRDHIEKARRDRPHADERQMIHDFLTAHDLTVTEHESVLDAWRGDPAASDISELARPSRSRG